MHTPLSHTPIILAHNTENTLKTTHYKKLIGMNVSYPIQNIGFKTFSKEQEIIETHSYAYTC